jgi:hypothetical protein
MSSRYLGFNSPLKIQKGNPLKDYPIPVLWSKSEKFPNLRAVRLHNVFFPKAMLLASNLSVGERQPVYKGL